jgi:hypothetical protein
MKASWHTETMLAEWKRARVDRADLALRRSSGAMLWQRNLALEDLPLAWARAENAHGAEVYVRQARGRDWPMVFLDDVLLGKALEAARSHGGMAIQTSPVGGCHLWLPCAQPLNEERRHQAQRWLAESLGGDLGSVSGEHLGRLAGFKNWKRGGCWVNVVAYPQDRIAASLRLVIPADILEAIAAPRRLLVVDNSASGIGGFSGRDSSPSGQEWGWVCRMLESGWDPEHAYQELLQRACYRRGQDAERYARRTVERAMAKVRSDRA